MRDPGSLESNRAMSAGAALALSLSFSLLGAACAAADEDEPANGTTTGTSGTSSAGGAGGGTSGVGGSGGSGSGGGQTAADMVCQRWSADRADLGEGTWSGSVASCDPGDVSADGRANALKLVNLYRSVAGLPPVTNDATRDQKAQACALMMHANNQLSHTPPMSWTCYSADGAEGAGNSNISGTAGVAGVDLYMADPGNETTMGHRRWILSGSLGPIGLGSTSGYSCMWVIGGGGSEDRPFTAWPSAGVFPIQAMSASFAPVDQTGWTIQSSTIDLSGAVVSVTDGGEDRPMAVTQLAGGYGSTYAIRMVPQGWTSQAGHTYSVSVSGTSEPISYQVTMVDCN